MTGTCTGVPSGGTASTDEMRNAGRPPSAPSAAPFFRFKMGSRNTSIPAPTGNRPTIAPTTAAKAATRTFRLGAYGGPVGLAAGEDLGAGVACGFSVFAILVAPRRGPSRPGYINRRDEFLLIFREAFASPIIA